MGVFDFLKVTVQEKRKPAPAQRGGPGSAIEFDGKSFPLAVINTQGFVATNFDGSLIKGQNARITVRVADQFGNFTFQTTAGISEVKDGKVAGNWSVLPADVDAAIRKYAQARKKAGR
ncbi:hypothetical protein [Azospirillum sp. sgz302134]